MKQNKQKEPMQETTKDDSSDVKKVKESQTEDSATLQQIDKDKSKENEEAQKGHA